MRKLTWAAVLVVTGGGCATMMTPSYVREISYDLALRTVERPAETKERWGNVEEVTLAEEEKYRYTDDLIDITIGAIQDQFVFQLKNQTDHSIKLLWDEAVFIDTDGSAGRVMHEGVRYADRNASQPASVIPAGAKFTDLVLPSDKIWYREGYYGTYYSKAGDWEHLNLIEPSYDIVQGQSGMAQPATAAPDTLLPLAQQQVGERVGLLLPFEIQGVVNEYTFWFEIVGAEVLPLVPISQHRFFN